jgi:3-hydroxyisobutyrate dehydrogenase-like beta-hydroxyacid dehydrogenase
MSTTDAQPRLGYIGLGNMGAPMAQRLVDWPGGVTVFDVRAEAMVPLTDAGAKQADSVAGVAASADIISVTVLDDAQVREVVAELAANAKPGTVIAIHSTIADTTAAELAEAAGLDLQALGRVVRHTDALTGGPGAIMLLDSTAPLPAEHFLREAFTHTRGLGEKDLRLALALGQATGVDLST